MILKPPKGTLVNRRHPIAVGLKAAWLFNEGGGDRVFDSSGHGHHGTFQNILAWRAGKFGSAIYFGGFNSYISIPLISAGSPLTYLAWAKSDNAAANGTVISQADSGDDEGDTYALTWTGSVANDPLLAHARSDTVTWNSAQSTKGFTADVWNQGAAVFHHSALRYAYFNGNSRGVNTVDLGDENDQNCAGIGYLNRATPANYFSGLIDHIFVWARALPKGEVAYMMKNPFCMYEVDL